MTDKPRKSRRGRRPAPESERKDRVIQTRVPQDLEDSLRHAAERERVTVSHLIRNVLEDSFRLVDHRCDRKRGQAQLLSVRQLMTCDDLQYSRIDRSGAGE